MFDRSCIKFNESVIHTTDEVKAYIKSEIPDISDEDCTKILWEHIDCTGPLDYLIYKFKQQRQFKEWNKSKNKKYWYVTTYSGMKKYVYMCEEQVKASFPKYKEA